jgi:hypothetical protein
MLENTPHDPIYKIENRFIIMHAELHLTILRIFVIEQSPSLRILPPLEIREPDYIDEEKPECCRKETTARRHRFCV